MNIIMNSNEEGNNFMFEFQCNTKSMVLEQIIIVAPHADQVASQHL